MELSDWFKGFEKGLASYQLEQRKAFFAECGSNCVKCGTLQVYKDLYDSASGDIDLFFHNADKLPGVKCETIEKSAAYYLYFTECNLCASQKRLCLNTFALRMFKAKHPLCSTYIMEQQNLLCNALRLDSARRAELQN